MEQNHSSSIFFISRLITLFHFSLSILNKRGYLHLHVFFVENKGIMLQTLREKQKYQVTNVDVEKLKLSRLLV